MEFWFKTCMNSESLNEVMSQRVTTTHWGVHQGQEVFLFRIENAQGAYIELTNFGATLVSCVVPDQHRQLTHVVLGFPSLAGYIEDACYIGSTVGRFANRIGHARFQLDGVEYKLDKNDGGNSNHGGHNGFHKKIFTHTVGNNHVTFGLTSPDGEGGFPGNLHVSVTYKWNDAGELRIEYTAKSDKKTVVNLTNHAYFNLSGSNTIFHHLLCMNAGYRLESTSEHIPTGKIQATDRIPGEWKQIKESVTDGKEARKGLNTYYLSDQDNEWNEPICALTDATTGIQLTVHTSYPGVQVYTGDFLNSTTAGHNQTPYRNFEGICLECQYPPDSPNKFHFQGTVLSKGSMYSEYIVYKFGLCKKGIV